jgi:L-aminopeptidase/D-esterase-like protein
MTQPIATIVLLLLAAHAAPGETAPGRRPRARELGLAALIGGTPAPLDAITDVAGVEVGHTTLVEGDGPLVVGKGPVRTGVTVVHPRGKANPDPVFGAWFTLNGNGEMTGTTWLQESGVLEGPLAITNTHSVGVVRDAILQWQVSRPGLQPWGLPVVAETYDGTLNDINGFHVAPQHVLRALDGAAGGPVPEGNVGGGTGMICHEFKGGIGTASRLLPAGSGGYTVGVLVQCNYGRRPDLRVAGVPVGAEIPDLAPCLTLDVKTSWPTEHCPEPAPAPPGNVSDTGSIIVVVATDAPLLPHQLKRLATRVALGVGRMGGFGGNGSGDIFLAFSTSNPKAAGSGDVVRVEMLPNARMSPLFQATVEATEEAILNALLAAETMTGANGVRVFALPHDRLLEAMRKYGRIR